MPDAAHDFRLSDHVPHLAEYFGFWAVLPEPFLALAEQVLGGDLSAHVLAPKQAAGKPNSEYAITKQGVAIIDISGTLMKQASSFSSEDSSTVAARRKLRAAANDSAVAAIVLRIDSPGGAVSGTYDLVDDVAAARGKKPVLAYIEDVGASAAYAIASAASEVYANRSALVGSIGTYAVVQDASSRAEKMGVKVHVIRSGAHKGSGMPGTEVTAEQLAEWQRMVESLNEQFIASVASGRKLSLDQVRELADGRVHVAGEALALKLIDGVATFDQVLAKAHAAGKTKPQQSPSSTPRNSMTTQELAAPLAPAAASIKEIKAGCPGITNDFAVALLEDGATLAQAQGRWMAKQAELLATRDKELPDAQAKAKTAAETKLGVDALKPDKGSKGAKETEATYDGGDPIAAWDERIAAKVAAGQSKAKAVRGLALAEPELHAAYVAEYNRQNAAKVTRYREHAA